MSTLCALIAFWFCPAPSQSVGALPAYLHEEKGVRLYVDGSYLDTGWPITTPRACARVAQFINQHGQEATCR